MESVCNVFIEGDKKLFKSKNSIIRFKQKVRNDDYNLEELSKLYLKTGYLFRFKDKTSQKKTFYIQELTDKEKREKFKKEIKLIRELKNKYNNALQNYKSKVIVPKNILKEYNKLTSLTNASLPIPNPYLIFENPEEYKIVIKNMISDKIFQSLPSSHPYVKYFRYLSEYFNIEPSLPIPTNNFLQETLDTNKLDEMIKLSKIQPKSIEEHDTESDEEL
jgi:hypothetical protein